MSPRCQLCPVLKVQVYGPFYGEAESRVPQVIVVASPNDHTVIGSSITYAYAADAALKGPGHDKNPSSVPGFALRIVKHTVSFTIARSTSQTTSSSSRLPRQGCHRKKVHYCSKHASATSANLAAGLRYAPRGNGSNQAWSRQVPSLSCPRHRLTMLALNIMSNACMEVYSSLSLGRVAVLLSCTSF